MLRTISTLPAPSWWFRIKSGPTREELQGALFDRAATVRFEIKSPARSRLDELPTTFTVRVESIACLRKDPSRLELKVSGMARPAPSGIDRLTYVWIRYLVTTQSGTIRFYRWRP